MSKKKYDNFIDRIVAKDLRGGYFENIATRFPPEPNGYLHIGSAYAINISYSIAKKYDGKFNLRFDDTNPTKEDFEYVKAIEEDLNWLGADYGDKPYFGSDYLDKIYDYAIYLINKGKAYVCDLTFEQMQEYRGTLTTPGKNSPYRDRTPEENLKLFKEMKNGKYKEGEKTLRAKIDMESPNILMRDPVIYRITYSDHYRTGDKWCIYPMYDFAHPLQDYIENITHSLCSNEFKNHRPLYNWVLNELDLNPPKPKQIEFGRMNLTGVVTSKRYLKELVESGYLSGWDDPRLPTIKGMKRRGFTRESIINFLNEIGVAKTETTIDYMMLEHFLRQDLKDKAYNIMTVVNPLKVTITNLDENHLEYLPAGFNITGNGERKLSFTKNLYIEREDFQKNPDSNFKRLSPGKEVRLWKAYFIKCNEVIEDENGNVIELKCTYDIETKSGSGFKGRKVDSTIHWLSAKDTIKCKVNHFDKLFNSPPDSENLLDSINKNSKKTFDSFIEPTIKNLLYDENEKRFQFMRNGFYIVDKDSKKDNLIFNQIVPLKSSYKG